MALRAALMKVCLSLPAATGKVMLIHLLTMAWPCMPYQHWPYCCTAARQAGSMHEPESWLAES